jgi:Protein of unknown function (DUF2442)
MKVVRVTRLDSFRLSLTFENGESGVADLSDLAGRGVMSSWDDYSIFEQASVTEAGAVEWPGGIDICGDSLYLRVTNKEPEQLYPSLSVSHNA